MLFKSLNQIISSSSSSSSNNSIVSSNDSNLPSLFELNNTAATNKFTQTYFSRPMMINY